jgi:glycosyltransferase involved in cell wall biosynthesis
MKILYLSYTMPKPGEPLKGMFVYNRIKKLNEKNVNLKVVTTSSLFRGLKNWGRDYNFKDLGFDLDLKVANLAKIENPLRYMDLFRAKNLVRLKKIAIKTKCDLVHAQFVRDGYYAYFLKKRYCVPYVVTCQGYDVTTVPFYNHKMRKKTLEILQSADKAIFVSNSLMDKAKSFGYSGKNSCVIPNGFDSSVFKILNNDDNRIRIHDNSERVIGFCAALIKRKRADKLPEILAQVNKVDKNIKMVIIGDGPCGEEIKTRIKNNGLNDKVLFTGKIEQSEIAKYMNEMDVFILPSISEGYPTVVSEAQGCGLPVVCSDAVGVPEAVGDRGIVVKQGDNFEKRFAEGIIKMLNNPVPREKILKRARSYEWDILVDKEIKVYDEIIDGRNSIYKT